ncbi:MAG: hypothetical protein H7A23_06395 [Leptospiraceae bacterium]|nr:hypothetical protein [Leptospiraceae bacterium]MCP5494168.1 hypothetical protein [Leptospiraceae bacterium]
MGTENEKINILNQLTKIIDSQATRFRSERKMMPQSRFVAEKKLLLENINNGIELASQIKSSTSAKEIEADFRRLHKEISGLKFS